MRATTSPGSGRQRSALFTFDYRRSPDQDRSDPARHPIVIVGAGPVGLTLALDLAYRGMRVILLDDADRIGEGSRGICYAKRTLEIWDRLGIAKPMLEKGVVWQKGKVFQADRLLYEFDLLPEGGHKMPAFINLQQYYVEKYLVEAIAGDPRIDLRWRNKVTGLERRADGVRVSIETPDGPYRLECAWLVACDGARSTCRGKLNLAFHGEVFDDQFLIADVRMTAPFPTERWFWFDPPFHSGRSALLHKQPDDVWRIDLQLSPEADAERESLPEAVVPRIERMLGHRRFELEWVSVYRFQCRRLSRFVHGRVIFAGDSAHQVSPFGARGANSGVQDAENLAWKLALVAAGTSPPSLLDSYDVERGQAADENIANSTRATDFIAPRSPAEQHLRDAALALSGHAEFAKRFVNSGRLSTPTTYASPLSIPDRTAFGGIARIGAPIPDAPILDRDGAPGWLLERLGAGFSIIAFPGGDEPALPDAQHCLVVGRDIIDPEGILTMRLGAEPGSMYVIRPDQHLAARAQSPEPDWVFNALARAQGSTRRKGEGAAT